MRIVLLVGLLACCGSLLHGQVISLDSLDFYAGKRVTVYGKVSGGTFDKLKRNDTTLVQMGDSTAAQSLTLRIAPLNRAAFGYQPENLWTDQVIYVTGVLQKQHNNYLLDITSPFDVSFSRPVKTTNNDGATPGDTAPQPPIREAEKAKPAKGKDVKKLPGDVTADPALNLALQAQQGTNKTEKNRESKKKPPVADTTAPSKKAKAAPKNAETATVRHAEKAEKAGKKPAKKAAPAAPVADTPTDHTTAANNTQTYQAAAGNRQYNGQMSDTLVGRVLVLPSRTKLKNGPGNFFTTSTTLAKGTKIQVISCSFDWCKISGLQPVDGRIIPGYVQVKKLLKK